MAKQELNLLQLAAGGTAEASAASSEVVGREIADSDLGGELFHDMPDELFRYSFAPSSTGATDTPKEVALIDSGGPHPVVQQVLHPVWDRSGSNVTTFPRRSTIAQWPSGC